MFKVLQLNKEEKRCILIGHTTWVRLVYDIPHILLLSMMYTEDILLRYTYLCSIMSIIDVINSKVHAGLVYEKEKEFIGMKLLGIFNLITLFILLSLNIGVEYKLAVACGISQYLTSFNNRYLNIHYPTKKAVSDILYVPFSIVCIACMYIFNPFKNIIYTIFIGSILMDGVWSFIEIIYCKACDKYLEYAKERTSFKEEFKYFKLAILREMDSLVGTLIRAIADMILTKHIVDSATKYAVVYTLMANIKIQRVATELNAQYKRILINNLNVNMLKLQRVYLSIIGLEGIVIQLIVMYMNFKTLNFIDLKILMMCLTLYISTYTNVRKKNLQIYLKKNIKTKALVEQITVYTVLTSLVRVFIDKVEYIYVLMYIVEYLTFILAKKAVSKTDYYNLPKYLQTI